MNLITTHVLDLLTPRNQNLNPQCLRRIYLLLASGCPHQELFGRIHRQLQAVPL